LWVRALQLLQLLAITLTACLLSFLWVQAFELLEVLGIYMYRDHVLMHRVVEALHHQVGGWVAPRGGGGGGG
jgi:hypothetical protein